MRILRRISQGIFFLLFFLLFLLASYPLRANIPVDFFLRFDPLLGISSSLASRSFLLKSLPGLILLLLVIFLGRFFCGWICPMGTTIDAFHYLFRIKHDNKRSLNLKWLKFGFLVVVLTAAIFSVQIVGFVDPIPLFTRTVVIGIYPLFVLLADGLLGFLMSVTLIQDTIFRLNEVLRGFILPINIVFFQSSVIIFTIFFVFLALEFVQRRFWCRNLCPLGALLGLFSKMRLYRRRVSEDCTNCGLCRNSCRMDAIASDFKTTDSTECISCMDCQKVCPVNAVSFGFTKKPEVTKVDFSRRRFLTAGVAGFLAAGALTIGFSNPIKNGYIIRPPGAVDEDNFLDKCVRCGECIRVCSTAGGGLQYTNLGNGLEKLWTPVLVPEAGYCEYNCNLCGQVCPTGAIQPLNLMQKQKQKIGTAHFNKTRCIPWYYGENCMVCEEHCPLPEKAIKFRESKIITIDGKNATVLLPYVDEQLCIGCGICVTRCPVEGDKGIFITADGEERITV